MTMILIMTGLVSRTKNFADNSIFMESWEEGGEKETHKHCDLMREGCQCHTARL